MHRKSLEQALAGGGVLNSANGGTFFIDRYVIATRARQKNAFGIDTKSEPGALFADKLEPNLIAEPVEIGLNPHNLAFRRHSGRLS